MNRCLFPLALWLLLAAPASSQDPDPAPPEPSGGDSPHVELDKLLTLPSTLEYSVEKRGGLTPGEWRSRFNTIHSALAEERKALEQAEQDLERVAGTADAWMVGPPMPGGAGGGAESPLDFRIRQAIQRHRLEIERLERQLRETEVEANLAAVPESWRH